MAVHRAGRLIDLGRAEAAIRLLTAHLATDPHDRFALVELARAYRSDGNTADELRTAAAALALDPTDADAYWYHVNALLDLGRYDEAATAAEELLRLAPEDPASHFTMAEAMRKLPDRQADVLPHALRVVELDPGYSGGHVLLGQVYGDRNREDLEEQCYLRALEIDPEDAYARANLSGLRLRQSNFDEALKGFKAAAALDPQNEEFHDLVIHTITASLLRAVYTFAALALVIAWLISGFLSDDFRPDSGAVGIAGAVSSWLTGATGGPGWPLRIIASVGLGMAWVTLLAEQTRKTRQLPRYLRDQVGRLLLTRVRALLGLRVWIVAVSQVIVAALLLMPSLGRNDPDGGGSLWNLATTVFFVVGFGLFVIVFTYGLILDRRANRTPAPPDDPA